MIINHNLSAMFASRTIGANSGAIQNDIERLSSGLRITRAGHDASGLAVSEKMRSQIRGLTRAQANAEDGISFIQTTEGYLQESQDILQRLRELAVQAANGIYTPEDRMQIQVEVSQLVDEIDRIASHAQFNGLNMLTGRFGRDTGNNVVLASMWFHIGANMDQRERVFIGTMTAQGLGIRDRASGDTVASRRMMTPTAPSAPSTWRCARSTSSGRIWAHTRTASSTPSAELRWAPRTCRRPRREFATPIWRRR